MCSSQTDLVNHHVVLGFDPIFRVRWIIITSFSNPNVCDETIVFVWFTNKLNEMKKVVPKKREQKNPNKCSNQCNEAN